MWKCIYFFFTFGVSFVIGLVNIMYYLVLYVSFPLSMDLKVTAWRCTREMYLIIIMDDDMAEVAFVGWRCVLWSGEGRI